MAITATDKAGNTATESVTVTYVPPTVETTTPPRTLPLHLRRRHPNRSGTAVARRSWRVEIALNILAAISSRKYWPANLVNCALNILYFESYGDARAYNSSGPGFEGLFQHHSGYWKGRAAAAGFRDSDGLYAKPLQRGSKHRRCVVSRKELNTVESALVGRSTTPQCSVRVHGVNWRIIGTR